MTVPVESQKPVESAERRGRVLFCVEGLSARNELLLKSLIRLLDHRTHQQWCYSVKHAQLRIVAEDSLAPVGENPAFAERRDGSSVLVIGHAQQQYQHFLHLPLHANELELMLNKLGAQLARFDVLTGSAVQTEAAFSDNAAFVLRKWPAATLLDTPARIRLATLMRGKPMTASLLQKRSGSSVQECIDFMDVLLREKLLEPVGAASSAATVQQSAVAPQASLLAAKPAALAEEMASALQSSRPSTGLLSRIRSRLGLSLPYSS